jgi:hypothetical protein
LGYLRGLKPEEFVRSHPDWADNFLLNPGDSPERVQQIGIMVLMDQGGLRASAIEDLKAYTTDQMSEVYGPGVVGASLWKLPKSQAIYNIVTHPRPPWYQFWKSGGPDVSVGCSVGAAECVYDIR